MTFEASLQANKQINQTNKQTHKQPETEGEREEGRDNWEREREFCLVAHPFVCSSIHVLARTAQAFVFLISLFFAASAIVFFCPLHVYVSSRSV